MAGRLNEPSRLKGMETRASFVEVFITDIRLNEPSRLKGMETKVYRHPYQTSASLSE